jgi:predicted flap endonuclease-1-like 5' DNA nuclease
MDYLIEQIFWYMIAAFVTGAAVGWFVGLQAGNKKVAALQAKLDARKSGTPVESIEGIGAGFSSRLKADGISTTDALLKLCASDEGVAKVCKCVDLDDATVRNWGIMADLMRVKGLGGQWAELMWRAGVTSVQDLAQRDIGPLRARMREVNEEEHRVAELPGESRVAKFLEDAARLDPVLPDRA